VRKRPSALLKPPSATGESAGQKLVIVPAVLRAALAEDCTSVNALSLDAPVARQMSVASDCACDALRYSYRLSRRRPSTRWRSTAWPAARCRHCYSPSRAVHRVKIEGKLGRLHVGDRKVARRTLGCGSHLRRVEPGQVIGHNAHERCLSEALGASAAAKKQYGDLVQSFI
jgi:hypothetical protein